MGSVLEASGVKPKIPWLHPIQVANRSIGSIAALEGILQGEAERRSSIAE